MSNKKELLKKSLGISEYPWSSDDEETQPMPDVNLLRRQTSEPRPSIADLPGTSGQSRPTADNNSSETFDWTAYTSSSSHKTPTTRSRLFDSAPRPQNNLAEIEVTRPNGQPSIADIQRMLAIKKLTRTLGSLRSSKSSPNIFPTSPRSITGPTRNPPFPSLKAEIPKAFKHKFKPSYSCRGSYPYSYSASNYHNSTTAQLAAMYASKSRMGRPTPSTFEFAPSARPADEHATSEPIVVIDSPSVDANDNDNEDDIEIDSSDLPTASQAQEDNRVDDNIEVMDTSNNASGSGVSLEEEIVEIDPQDDTDGNANGDSGADNSVINADVSLNEVQIIKSSNDEADPSPTHRSDNDKKDDHKSTEDGEPYTVKEFNQSLLRLLECPVCLEWMEPPMSQCRRGHLVCGRCRARLASCPVCRTTFSSVRNRAMEGVAEMVRYPCRHGCGREVRLRRRGAHEASCGARRYACPAPACAHRAPLARDQLTTHFQSKHMTMMKIGRKHKFSMKVNSEQHDTWIVAALHEYFSLRVDVDIRTWGVVVYVAYIGPKCNAKNFIYEVSVVGQHNSRKLVYTRATHCDLESSSLNVSRQDCFHLTLDQALNFLRVKNRHCEPDKFLDFNVEISKCEIEIKDDSDS